MSVHTYLVVSMQQIKLEAAREIRDLEGVEESAGDQRGDEVIDRHSRGRGNGGIRTAGSQSIGSNLVGQMNRHRLIATPNQHRGNAHQG